MVETGKSYPIGATICGSGVNFSIYSRNATGVNLLFFDHIEDLSPSRIISLDPKINQTDYYWHIFVPGVASGQIYAYQIFGPFAPEEGHRFDPDKFLMDPYSKSVVIPENYNRKAANHPGKCPSIKSIVLDTSAYDWEDDRHPRHPYSKTIIYELHIGGFTRHPSSGVSPEKKGTYAGLIEKIPYLTELGITAVELMPVFQFDEQDAPKDMTNYWGYTPVSFFAPHIGYSSQKDALGAINEFRDMVKALHKANIEVILDVVYNHTTEGDEHGPTISFKGIENRAYYLLDQEHDFQYKNFSGTGNTLNGNHSVVRRMIIDSLKYWVSEMHVDGFRFDLASILSRDEFGVPLKNPPILWSIESNPVLAGTKLIAEAWDAGGLYQVGTFVGDKWKEWNGKFRDDVRKFLKGDDNSVSSFTTRLFGSPDIFGHKEQQPEHSINFVTAHDGFTLNDLVSYNYKHNELNGENNRDGDNHNNSWNHGVEGPTADPEIERLRKKQIKNFHLVNLLSYGIPMILMGDEIRRTQQGNNNAYCQDNEISWLDWGFLQKHGDILHFVKTLIEIRNQRYEHSDGPNISLQQFLHTNQVEWHGIHLNQPDWSPQSHSIAMTVWTYEKRFVLHLLFNAYYQDLTFELPDISEFSGKHWHLLVDTDKEYPNDIFRYANAPIISEQFYKVAARSVVILVEALPK